MKNNHRRNFIKATASLAAAVSTGGIIPSIARSSSQNNKTTVSHLAKDAGMQASEAYFSGMDERKIALLKQMDVFGAVG